MKNKKNFKKHKNFWKNIKKFIKHNFWRNSCKSDKIKKISVKKWKISMIFMKKLNYGEASKRSPKRRGLKRRFRRNPNRREILDLAKKSGTLSPGTLKNPHSGSPPLFERDLDPWFWTPFLIKKHSKRW